MEIFNLLSSYRDLLSKIKELSEQIDKRRIEVNAIQQKVDAAIADVEKQEKMQHDALLNKFVSDHTSELSDELTTLKKEKEAQARGYEEDRASLTEAVVSDDYTEEQSIIDEVQMILGNTRDCLKEAIGENTYNNLSSRIEDCAVDITIDDLHEMVDCFNDTESLLVMISKLHNPFLLLISKLEGAKVSDKEINFKYAMPVFCIAYIVTFILLSKYVFIFVAAALIVSFVYGIVSTIFLHKMLVSATVIQTNLDTIIDDLHKRILDDRDERINNLDSEYADHLNEYQDKINSVMEQLQQAEDAAGSKFNFDNGQFTAQKNNLLQERDSRVRVLNTEIKDMQARAVAMSKERTALETKIKDRLDHVQDELMTVGTEKKLEPTFLIDVNPENYAVTTFTFPMSSFLCLYENQDEVYNFIRLICAQIRSKLNPYNFNITVCDPVRMGAPFFKMVSTDDEDVEAQRMFKIVDSDNDIKRTFDELSTALRKKNKIILAAASDLDSYNDFMISIDSITEPYEFYFVINPSTAVYQSDSFIQLVQNGAPVGMYVLVFTSVACVQEAGNAGLKFVECFNAHYRMFKGTIKPLSKKTVIDGISRKR